MPQIDHIICPIDFTDASARALGYALAWSRWYGAHIHVFHVAPVTVVAEPLGGVALALGPRSLDDVRNDVERFVSTVPNPDAVPIDIQVFEGDPPSFIRRQAQRYQRSVVMMGAHGRGVIDRLVLGSVTERVIGDAVSPTLVVPPHDAQHTWAPPLCKRILCAVDLLPSSLESLRYAISLANEADSQLEVVYVVEDAAADAVQLTQHFRVPEYLRYRADEALQELRRQVGDEARQACSIHERVVFGSPATEILRAARELDAELLVMGAGDHAHLRTLWLGHATSRIVREVTCPILVVPTPVVLKKARVLTHAPVARERWRQTFDRISLEHLGDPATVTVLEQGFAAPEATALPLVGVTMDGPPTYEVTVMLGGPDTAHISHGIARPSEVFVDQSAAHGHTRLLIRSADGTATLIEARRHVPSPFELAAYAGF